LENVFFDAVILSGIRKFVLFPDGVNYVEPFGSAGVAVVVLFEANAIHVCLGGPPGRDNVQSEAAVADVIDVGGLLGEQSWLMKGGTDGDHQLDAFGDGGERGGGGPGVERWRFDAFDVVEI